MNFELKNNDFFSWFIPHRSWFTSGEGLSKPTPGEQVIERKEKGTRQDSLINLSFNLKASILLIIAVGFYFNSLYNRYALDDGVVIMHNQFVQQGFGGIAQILSADSYASFYGEMHSGQMLAGGRYRPLSVVLFAIEHQFFGDSPFVGHLMNVIYFLGCVFFLFYFLQKCLFIRLPGGGDMAFLATFLFVIHPIHTEVVANIKSSDELLSFLFLLFTLIFVYKNAIQKKVKYILCGSVSLFLALLSKEYGVIMFAIIPLFLYVVTAEKLSNALKGSIPYFGIIILYFIIRIHAVGLFHPHINLADPAVNPYAYASVAEKTASEIFILGRYLYMLFIPYPLCCDYSYSQIPYHHFSQVSVWLSLVIYMVIIIWSARLVVKRNILSVPVLFFLLSILLISNFLVDVGATMAERFLFHASAGFTAVLSFGFVKITKNIPLRRRQLVFGIFLTCLAGVCCMEAVERNALWKDNFTLFTHDVQIANNSFLTNSNAGAALIDFSEQKQNIPRMAAITDSAVAYLRKAVEINYLNSTGYINLALAYVNINMPDSAKVNADFAKYLNSQQPFLTTLYHLIAVRYFNKGVVAGDSGNKAVAIDEMAKALKADSSDYSMWYGFGRYYSKINQLDSAGYCWTKALAINPGYKDAKAALDSLNLREDISR